jgi:hypothetical protein
MPIWMPAHHATCLKHLSNNSGARVYDMYMLCYIHCQGDSVSLVPRQHAHILSKAMVDHGNIFEEKLAIFLHVSFF